MVLYWGSLDQQTLFRRLETAGDGRVGEWTCSVQGGGQHMVAMIMDRATGQTVWESAGPPDQIVGEFSAWLERRGR